MTTTEHPAAPPNRHERRRKAVLSRHGEAEEGTGSSLDADSDGTFASRAPPAEYVDEDGLAERYLIPPRTAQRWRASGGGPPFVRLGKRRVLYRIADVEAWLAARTFRSRADELSRQTAA